MFLSFFLGNQKFAEKNTINDQFHDREAFILSVRVCTASQLLVTNMNINCLVASGFSLVDWWNFKLSKRWTNLRVRERTETHLRMMLCSFYCPDVQQTNRTCILSGLMFVWTQERMNHDKRVVFPIVTNIILSWCVAVDILFGERKMDRGDGISCVPSQTPSLFGCKPEITAWASDFEIPLLLAFRSFHTHMFCQMSACASVCGCFCCL